VFHAVMSPLQGASIPPLEEGRALV
jgi:hypothetical protein